MVDVSQVRWGSYMSREGPYYYGKYRFKLPDDSDFLDEIFYVTAAAEGALESVNCYDKCRMTLGALQFCDAAPQLSATDLLGFVAEQHSDQNFLHNTLAPALASSGNATFKKNDRGKWRFFLPDGHEVNSTKRQEALYFGGATGLKGGWTNDQRAHARLWAACLSSVFENEEAGTLQCEFTKPKLMSFVRPAAKKLLFDDGDGSDAWVKLVRNAYITFAVNNPTWASQALHNAVATSRHEKWSSGWAIDVLRELTYFKGIKIYPKRYEHVARELEVVYGVRLPIHASELKTADGFIDPSDGAFVCLADVQAALQFLGHDPGQIDGLMGNNTKMAVKSFQEANGIEPTAILSSAVITTLAVRYAVKLDEPEQPCDIESLIENDVKERVFEDSVTESGSSNHGGDAIVESNHYASIDRSITHVKKDDEDSKRPTGFAAFFAAAKALVNLVLKIFKKGNRA